MQDNKVQVIRDPDWHSIASTLEGVLCFEGHLVCARDPSGSIFKACSSTESTAEAPEDKPSKDIGAGNGRSGDKETSKTGCIGTISSMQPCRNSIGFHSLDPACVQD